MAQLTMMRPRPLTDLCHGLARHMTDGVPPKGCDCVAACGIGDTRILSGIQDFATCPARIAHCLDTANPLVLESGVYDGDI